MNKTDKCLWVKDGENHKSILIWASCGQFYVVPHGKMPKDCPHCKRKIKVM